MSQKKTSKKSGPIQVRGAIKLTLPYYAGIDEETGKKVIEERAVELFYTNAEYAEIEFQLTEQRGTLVTMANLKHELQDTFSRSAATMMLWVALKFHDPDTTLEEAMKYIIDDSDKYYFMAAIARTDITQKDLDEIADTMKEADQARVKKLMQVLKKLPQIFQT